MADESDVPLAESTRVDVGGKSFILILDIDNVYDVHVLDCLKCLEGLVYDISAYLID